MFDDTLRHSSPPRQRVEFGSVMLNVQFSWWKNINCGPRNNSPLDSTISNGFNGFKTGLYTRVCRNRKQSAGGGLPHPLFRHCVVFFLKLCLWRRETAHPVKTSTKKQSEEKKDEVLSINTTRVGKICFFLHYLFFFFLNRCFFSLIFLFFFPKTRPFKNAFFFRRAPLTPGFITPKKIPGWEKNMFFLYYLFFFLNEKNKKNMFFSSTKKHVFFFQNQPSYHPWNPLLVK